MCWEGGGIILFCDVVLSSFCYCPFLDGDFVVFGSQLLPCVGRWWGELCFLCSSRCPCVLSSFAIISLRKRKLVTLL